MSSRSKGKGAGKPPRTKSIPKEKEEAKAMVVSQQQEEEAAAHHKGASSDADYSEVLQEVDDEEEEEDCMQDASDGDAEDDYEEEDDDEEDEEEEEEEEEPPIVVVAPKRQPVTKANTSKAAVQGGRGGGTASKEPIRAPSTVASNSRGRRSSSSSASSSSPSKISSVPRGTPSMPGEEDVHLKSPNFKLRTTAPDLKAYTKVITRLKEVYRRHILPLEVKYQFHKFGYEPVTDAELEAKAQVLLIGQYSTGKTTMVRYLLGQDFPGIHTGPEPTTDRFMAVVHGEEDSVIEGPLLEVTPELPYQGLSKQFGPALLSKFQASVSNSAVLRHLTFVDTPGILSGEKQRLSRQYDFPAVIRWLAERSDMVLVLFDVNKLDISDEFKEVLTSLNGLSNKVRLVLNKADSVKREELTRCYGAMMWSMSRVLGTPEVPKVNIGSFWEQPYRQQSLDSDTLFDFARDEANLINDLGELSRDNPKKKVNQLIHRIHILKVYMRLMSTLRSRLPYFGRARAQKALINSLPEILEEIRLRYKLPAGDMPPVDVIKQRLSGFPDFRSFSLIKDADVEELNKVISKDLATLMTELGGVTKAVASACDSSKDSYSTSYSYKLGSGRGGTGLCSLAGLFLLVLAALLIVALVGGVMLLVKGDEGYKQLNTWLEMILDM